MVAETLTYDSDHLLSSKELDDIMYRDQYLACPMSVLKYLNQFKISVGQRLIIERMIGFALQRPTRHQSNLRIRVSASFLSDMTSIDERNIYAALKVLKAKKLIEKIDTTRAGGTLYQINLASSLKEWIKERFKQPEARQSNDDSNHTHPPLQVNDTHKAISTEHLENAIRVLNAKIAASHDELNNLIAGTGPISKQSLLQTLRCKSVEVDVGNITKQHKIEAQIESYKRDISALIDQKRQIQAVNDRKTDIELPSRTTLPTVQKTSTRFLHRTDTKYLKTRIEKLSIFRSENERSQILKQIAWSIRFGWYTYKSWTTRHCINHAIKLLRNNDWRQPAKYNEVEISPLLTFQLRKNKNDERSDI